MNNLSDADLLENYNLPICLDYCHMIMGRNCFGFSADDLIKKLEPLVGHIHLADAAGIDGEGLAFGDGEPENLELFRNAFNYDCLKVIEVAGAPKPRIRLQPTLMKKNSMVPEYGG